MFVPILCALLGRADLLPMSCKPGSNELQEAAPAGHGLPGFILVESLDCKARNSSPKCL